jgi:hypothetical protein
MMKATFGSRVVCAMDSNPGNRLPLIHALGALFRCFIHEGTIGLTIFGGRGTERESLAGPPVAVRQWLHCG